jgi:hypothetical protein
MLQDHAPVKKPKEYPAPGLHISGWSGLQDNRIMYHFDKAEIQSHDYGI